MSLGQINRSLNHDALPIARGHLPFSSLAILAAIAGLAMAGCSPSANNAANEAGVNVEAASSNLAESSTSSEAGNIMAASSGASAMSSAASSAAPAGNY